MLQSCISHKQRVCMYDTPTTITRITRTNRINGITRITRTKMMQPIPMGRVVLGRHIITRLPVYLYLAKTRQHDRSQGSTAAAGRQVPCLVSHLSLKSYIHTYQVHRYAVQNDNAYLSHLYLCIYLSICVLYIYCAGEKSSRRSSMTTEAREVWASWCNTKRNRDRY